MILYQIYQGCYYFLEILRYALLIYCILSWFVSPWNKVMQFFGKIANPMLGWIRPVIRRIFPNLPIDLSAIVVFFLLNLAQRLLYRLYVLLAF